MAADQWQTSSLVWICAHKRNALHFSFLVFTRVHQAQHIFSHHCNKCQAQRTQHQHCLCTGRANSTRETLGRTEEGGRNHTHTQVFLSALEVTHAACTLATSQHGHFAALRIQFHLDSFLAGTNIIIQHHHLKIS